MGKPVIGVLIGDAGGVGPELVAKLLASGDMQKHLTPLLLGDSRVLECGAEACGLSLDLRVIQRVEDFREEGPVQLLQLEHSAYETVMPGQISQATGAACIGMIRTAVTLAERGSIQGICYAPLSKAAMRWADPAVSSETSLFAALLGVAQGYGEINMVDGVWTTRVTSHIPLKEVSDKLSLQSILECIVLASDTLQKAGYDHPRIGVAGLNPHAGEAGLCGDEEVTLITPAIEKAKALGIDASGPYPSDILFVNAFGGLLDAGVTMYHDQGQIALKLKGFDRGITLAGGLPVPITTCAHGTALDIAGKNRANTGSFLNAIAMVAKMAGG